MKRAFTQLETHFEDDEQSDSSIADSDDDTASVHLLVSQERIHQKIQQVLHAEMRKPKSSRLDLRKVLPLDLSLIHI